MRETTETDAESCRHTLDNGSRDTVRVKSGSGFRAKALCAYCVARWCSKCGKVQSLQDDVTTVMTLPNGQPLSVCRTCERVANGKAARKFMTAPPRSLAALPDKPAHEEALAALRALLPGVCRWTEVTQKERLCVAEIGAPHRAPYDAFAAVLMRKLSTRPSPSYDEPMGEIEASPLNPNAFLRSDYSYFVTSSGSLPAFGDPWWRDLERAVPRTEFAPPPASVAELRELQHEHSIAPEVIDALIREGDAERKGWRPATVCERCTGDEVSGCICGMVPGTERAPKSKPRRQQPVPAADELAQRGLHVYAVEERPGEWTRVEREKGESSDAWMGRAKGETGRVRVYDGKPRCTWDSLDEPTAKERAA